MEDFFYTKSITEKCVGAITSTLGLRDARRMIITLPASQTPTQDPIASVEALDAFWSVYNNRPNLSHPLWEKLNDEVRAYEARKMRFERLRKIHIKRNRNDAK